MVPDWVAWKADWMAQKTVGRMVGCWGDWMVQMKVGWKADWMADCLVQQMVH